MYVLKFALTDTNEDLAVELKKQLSNDCELRWVGSETTYWAYPDRWRYVMYADHDHWQQENPEIAYSIRCIKD